MKTAQREVLTPHMKTTPNMHKKKKKEPARFVVADRENNVVTVVSGPRRRLFTKIQMFSDFVHQHSNPRRHCAFAGALNSPDNKS